MGLSSKKTKTTPIVSDWMKPQLEDFSGRIGGFLDSDPQHYVAPASALQMQAFAGADDLGGWRPDARQAFDLAGDAATRGPMAAHASLAGARSIFDDGGMERFMDPALQSYIDPALDVYDADEARRFARLQADAARKQAFGGSRYGVALGDFEAESARGRAGLEAEMRRAAFEQARQTALAEAARLQELDLVNAGLQTDVSKTNAGLRESAEQRYLQAIGLLGDLTNDYGASDRADLGLLAELGAMQREIDGEFRGALPAQLQMAGSLFGAIPSEAYVGSKQKTGGGLVGDLLTGVAPVLAGKIKFGKGA